MAELRRRKPSASTCRSRSLLPSRTRRSLFLSLNLWRRDMKRSKAAVVGAAETTQLGVIPNMSQVQLHADAALNAVRDAGISISDIDGIATAGESPESLAHNFGVTPTYGDVTSVGGCSFLLPVLPATAHLKKRFFRNRAHTPCV